MDLPHTARAHDPVVFIDALKLSHGIQQVVRCVHLCQTMQDAQEFYKLFLAVCERSLMRV